MHFNITKKNIKNIFDYDAVTNGIYKVQKACKVAVL